MVAWGQSHPVFGIPMGGVLGLGLAAYAAEALTFLLGLWLYRRLGYNARLLFLAHFDWADGQERLPLRRVRDARLGGVGSGPGRWRS